MSDRFVLRFSLPSSTVFSLSFRADDDIADRSGSQKEMRMARNWRETKAKKKKKKRKEQMNCTTPSQRSSSRSICIRERITNGRQRWPKLSKPDIDNLDASSLSFQEGLENAKFLRPSVCSASCACSVRRSLMLIKRRAKRRAYSKKKRLNIRSKSSRSNRTLCEPLYRLP